jgi:hypothetical protein
MAAQAPTITNISVSGQTITIEGRNYDQIIWITGNPFRMNGNNSQGGGVIIETGNTLDLSEFGKYVWGNYVRAVLICRRPVAGTTINSHGVALTQPFGIFVEGGNNNVLVNLNAPPATRVLNFAVNNANEVIALLPQTAAIITSPVNSLAPLTVNWTAPANFNAAHGAANNFTWAVTLPSDVTNPNNIPLTGITFVTNHTPPSHIVNFVLNDDERIVSGQLTQTIPHGGTAVAPVIERDGFLHNGWSVAFTNVTAPVNVTARWLRLGAVSTNGSGNVTSEDVTHLARHVVGHNGFTLANNRLGNLAALDRPPTMADVTLIAKWLVGYNLNYLISITPQ